MTQCVEIARTRQTSAENWWDTGPRKNKARPDLRLASGCSTCPMRPRLCRRSMDTLTCADPRQNPPRKFWLWNRPVCPVVIGARGIHLGIRTIRSRARGRVGLNQANDGSNWSTWLVVAFRVLQARRWQRAADLVLGQYSLVLRHWGRARNRTASAARTHSARVRGSRANRQASGVGLGRWGNEAGSGDAGRRAGCGCAFRIHGVGSGAKEKGAGQMSGPL